MDEASAIEQPSDVEQPSDAELGTRARAGDRNAFAHIYERYASAVHGVLLATAPIEEAHDLVHDVFLLALRSIASLQEPERIGAWLFTIARNRANDAHRAKGRALTLVEEHDPQASSADLRDEDEEAASVLRAIRALPESYRETLTLRLVEGLSGPEIAARCGLTHGSVRINLHRGMKLLRERLERKEGQRGA